MKSGEKSRARTFRVQLVGGAAGTGSFGKYRSWTGRLPRVGDVIKVDGLVAQVTQVTASTDPPIRAEIIEF